MASLRRSSRQAIKKGGSLRGDTIQQSSQSQLLSRAPLLGKRKPNSESKSKSKKPKMDADWSSHTFDPRALQLRTTLAKKRKQRGGKRNLKLKKKNGDEPRSKKTKLQSRDTRGMQENEMNNKVVSAKGRLSPEYKTITKNFGTLASILELPINSSIAATELVEAELISSSGITTGKDMIDSVLKYVEFDAMKFYKFLAVLQNLTSTESIFKELHQVFFEQLQHWILSDAYQAISITIGAAFISFSRQKPYSNSVDSRQFAGKFYRCLEKQGCNPWMDAKNLQSGDVLSITIFKTLDECKALVPVVTRGYARSLWCMRELYYATFKRSTQMHPVVIEDGWQREEGGKWLENTLKQVKMHLHVNPADKKKMADIASNIAKALHLPSVKPVSQVQDEPVIIIEAGNSIEGIDSNSTITQRNIRDKSDSVTSSSTVLHPQVIEAGPQSIGAEIIGYPCKPKAILLIGSTGNGKSTLGNFLLDPSEQHMFCQRTFKTGDGCRPETNIVQSEERLIKLEHSFPLFTTIIDTPGLNENDEQDLSHMIDIVQSLQKVDSVLACILVVKFASRIDAQYKRTVKYYSKLMPSLFQRNVIIVMTEFRNDIYSERLRQMEGKNVNKIKSDAIAEIRENAGLSYDPLLFAVDCLALDETEREDNMRVRQAICGYIAQLMPIATERMMVAKTDLLAREDKEEIRELRGKISGYNKKLKETHKQATSIFEKIEKKEQEIISKDEQLQSLQSELDEKNTSELVVATNWSVNEEWRLFRWLSKEFDVSSAYKIEQVKKWTNGNCEWKDFKANDHRVSGRVEGRFFRGLYASLCIYTTKRIKFQEEIKSLESQIEETKAHRDTLSESLDEITGFHEESKMQIALLKKFIEETREKIKNLSTDYVTLDEAQRRLNAVKNKRTTRK